MAYQHDRSIDDDKKAIDLHATTLVAIMNKRGQSPPSQPVHYGGRIYYLTVCESDYKS